MKFFILITLTVFIIGCKSDKNIEKGKSKKETSIYNKT